MCRMPHSLPRLRSRSQPDPLPTPLSIEIPPLLVRQRKVLLLTQAMQGSRLGCAPQRSLCTTLQSRILTLHRPRYPTTPYLQVRPRQRVSQQGLLLREVIPRQAQRLSLRLLLQTASLPPPLFQHPGLHRIPQPLWTAWCLLRGRPPTAQTLSTRTIPKRRTVGRRLPVVLRRCCGSDSMFLYATYQVCSVSSTSTGCSSSA
jgi:hypothetical protein